MQKLQNSTSASDPQIGQTHAANLKHSLSLSAVQKFKKRGKQRSILLYSTQKNKQFKGTDAAKT